MIETNGKKLFRGEAALALAVLINSFGVVLMLYSGAGILSLMIMRKKFVTSYLFSFAVGFVFSELLDVHELWITVSERRQTAVSCPLSLRTCSPESWRI